MIYSLPEYNLNLHGWNSTSVVFVDLIAAVKPQRIIEVGSWYGGSAIHMAEIVKVLHLPTEIICVDTWLGSLEHWESYREQLQLVEGFPTIYFQFITNVQLSGHSDIIRALPMTSRQAAEYFKNNGVYADLIYLDCAHDEISVALDLEAYAPLLMPDGVLFGDDYKGWPGVTAAVDKFIAAHDCGVEIYDDVFWIISHLSKKGLNESHLP